jgi:hypothetical protein
VDLMTAYLNTGDQVQNNFIIASAIGNQQNTDAPWPVDDGLNAMPGQDYPW